MKKKHEIKTYNPTTKGYNELANDDMDLASVSRNVAMSYLPHYYQKGTVEEKRDGYQALIDAANLAGFKISIFTYVVGSKVKHIKRFPKYRDYNFYRELFANFKDEVKAIEYDPDDEHGLCDESVKVANLIFKYKNIIALRIKKKNIFEKAIIIFKNIFG